MSDVDDPEGREMGGFNWRLRRAGDDGRLDLPDQATFEFANSEGTVVTLFSIPAETINTLLRPHLSTFAELQLDGTVLLDVELSAVFEAPLQKADILQLVTDALSPKMLQDEPNIRDQLNELRRKLTEAITVVDRTLADLDEQSD
jgi:hypothetical protein